MKNNLYVLSFLFFAITTQCLSVNAYASKYSSSKPYLLVSDFDDTIKLSHSTSPFDTTLRAIFTSQAFRGTQIEYVALSKVADLAILSDSSKLLEENVEYLLNKFNYPEYTLYLKPVFHSKDYQHKPDTLEKLSQENPNKKFILIGDDTLRDPEVLTAFRHKHPEQVLAIFIHRVTNKKIPEENTVFSFYTVFDSAAVFYALGLINLQDVQNIANRILCSEKQYIIPSYAYCPKASAPLPSEFGEESTEVSNIRHLIDQDLNTYCSNR